MRRIATLLLLLAGCHGETQSTAANAPAQNPEDPTQSVVAEDKPKGPVLLIGLDAASPKIITEMVAAGELPHIASLIKQGSSGILMSERPMRSPALWTTIATGQPRAVHGIYDFVTGSRYWPKARQGEEKRLVTSAMRQSPALWQFSSAAKMDTLVIGWLNSWPAEPINGLMVAPYVALGHKKQTSIKGKIYKATRGQVHPKSARQMVQDHIVTTDDIENTLLSSLADVPPADSQLYVKVPKLKRYVYSLKWSLAGALTNFDLFRTGLKESKRDLAMTFFDGVDTLGHRFWLFSEPLPNIRRRLAAHGFDPSIAEEMKTRFGQTVRNYYRFFDRELGKTLALVDESATVILISDHGFDGFDRARAVHSSTPFDGDHVMEGFFVAKGPKIVAQKLSDPLTQYDIAPTILTLLGLEIPEELPGRVPRELFRGVPNSARSVSLALDKRPSQNPQTMEIPFEDREIERLRALGYVQ